MAPKIAKCQICRSHVSKYCCPACRVSYCSASCYKTHKRDSCSEDVPITDPPGIDIISTPNAPSTCIKANSPETPAVECPAPPLLPLTSLKWPQIAEQSAYPDPLKRDDPKPLQLYQYESIATMPTIRQILVENPNIHAILRSLDHLRGPEREVAIAAVLGVGSHQYPHTISTLSGEEEKTLRRLAKAVEEAVQRSELGLDWELDKL